MAREGPQAEMVTEHTCPICGQRATLHCASCGGVYCAEHVVRGFALGYAFICLDCAGAAEETTSGEQPN